MQALIDGDILVYESAFAGQDRETGEIHSFDYVREIFDEKVLSISATVYGTETPLIYLTGSSNFRNEIAKTKPYKGGRKEEKPFHYHNLRAYASSLPNCIVSEGLEADDLICIEQYSRLKQRDTIICTRDKDLRMCPGYHYGWEHAGQPEFFPQWVDELGEIEINSKRNKLKGVGLKFFYSQVITGDSVDNIPGLPRGGPALAFDRISPCTSSLEMWDVVKTLYENKLGEGYMEYLMEQINLLWMVRELDEEGKPIPFKPPVSEVEGEDDNDKF